jgi:cell division protein FtsB
MRLVVQLLVILILGVATTALVKDVYIQATKFKEISGIENKVNSASKENQELKKKLDQSKSSFSMEKEARSKLGYQKPGEVLYVVSLEGSNTKETSNQENWQMWVDLFFR